MKIKKIISYSFSALMFICMLFIIAVIVHWYFFRPAPHVQQHSQIQTREVKNWQKLSFPGFHIGSVDAPVQIVEFFDYQCPYCKATQKAIKAILHEYPKKVLIVYENNPLLMHRYAMKAAIAAECVRHQAPTIFMAYHDSLFAKQARLGGFSYTLLATRMGITDTASFHQCVKTKEPAGLIKKQQIMAKKLGINAIPTFLINGRLATGALTKQQLDKLVQKELSKAGK
jgi:protein-disulfide isomerase